MFKLQSILSKIINNNCDPCCLCFNTTNTGCLSLADEVLFDNFEGCNVKVSEILAYVFGDADLQDMLTFSRICSECSTTVVSWYRFMRECRENLQYLSMAVQNLMNNLKQAPDAVQDCRNLFIEFWPEHGHSYLYYDSISSLSNASRALRRFRVITDTKKETDKVKQENKADKYNLTAFKCNPTAKNLRNHAKESKFPCTDCDKVFYLKSTLEAHKENTHSTLICFECGKSFKNNNSLKNHEKSHYIRIICPDCGRVYKNKNTFKKHFENKICQTDTRHNPAEAQYTCDYCQKRYTQKMTLRVHIQYEHLNYKYLKCRWCDKKFWCKSRLNAHAVKHTKERNYICNICHGKFVSKESLLYHTRIHTGERPYPCAHCDSRFLSASRRTAHIKTHHMDPTVECDICHAKFRSTYYLRRHKTKHTAENNTANNNKHSTPSKVVKTVYPPPRLEANISLENNKKVSIQNDKNQNQEESLENEPRLYYSEEHMKISQAAGEHTEVIETEVVEEGTVEYNMYQVMEGQAPQPVEDGRPMYVEVMEGNNKYFIQVTQQLQA